ncbi:unnamed protein product [Echinostoma caproni]|uniref:TGF_BETA_2 domain-containing protein n=1 Tax=Echinostoma caproni TaxID=27848 RepID=A0A183A703_9TREM|nr:unnamed protein product [Echinostoma caproni]
MFQFLKQQIRLFILVITLSNQLSATSVSSVHDEDSPLFGPLATPASDERNQDNIVVHLLSAVRGNPKSLSRTELNKLRQNTPSVAENFIRLINQERLLDDVIGGKLDKQTFDDLTRSLVFVDTAQCSMSRTEPSQTCLIFRNPIAFPVEPVTVAHLSAFIEPRASLCDIQLKLHFLNPLEHQFTEDVFHLPMTSAKDLGRFAQLANTRQEVTWDITAAVADLKSRLDQAAYPVIMTLECTGASKDTSWDVFSNTADILTPDRQAVIELLTAKTNQAKSVYSHRRLSGRSLGSNGGRSNLCPSFMDGERHMTSCCLFEYTLNKQQMDANPKLRFIIFPQHLPLNLCHGRCVGAPTDWRNSHVMLLNRYFEGLPPEEREVLYDSMPCCAANQTAPFTIVYKNQNNQLTTETLPNAKKISCACG